MASRRPPDLPTADGGGDRAGARDQDRTVRRRGTRCVSGQHIGYDVRRSGQPDAPPGCRHVDCHVLCSEAPCHRHNAFDDHRRVGFGERAMKGCLDDLGHRGPAAPHVGATGAASADHRTVFQGQQGPCR